MARLAWLGLGILGGLWMASRAKGRREESQPEGWGDVHWASTEFGAGTASLTRMEQPMASTAFSAGTASLPYEQQAIRDPKTVR